MSELRILRPEECTVPDETKRELVEDINRTLTSGTRLYSAARAHVGFIRELATASTWHVSHRPDDRGNTIQLLFTTSEDRVETACAYQPIDHARWSYAFGNASPHWIGASPR